MNIYVGNLNRKVSEIELKKMFESFGEVTSAKIIKDRSTGNSKGFGFVEMPTKTEAQSAIEGLNGKEINGDALIVNEARPRTEKRGGNGKRGYGHGGGRRY